MAYKKFLLVFLILSFVTSCILLDDLTNCHEKTLQRMTDRYFTNIDYSRGFKHGCRNGLLIKSNGYISDLNIKELAHNEQFSLGYNDGYEECSHIEIKCVR
jgi:hypothetical protein